MLVLSTINTEMPWVSWWLFKARKKRPIVANAAIARELAGWCWSLAVLED